MIVSGWEQQRREPNVFVQLLRAFQKLLKAMVIKLDFLHTHCVICGIGGTKRDSCFRRMLENYLQNKFVGALLLLFEAVLETLGGKEKHLL